MFIRSLIAAILSIALTALCVGCQSTATVAPGALEGYWSHYGDPTPHHGRPVAISQLRGDEQDVVIRGTINEICQTKGCWITVHDQTGEELFVRFRNYAFFVPRNATDRNVVLHGWAEKQEDSVELLRHYAEDAGRTPEEIAAITEPEVRITFFANTLLIEGAGLDAPWAPGDFVPEDHSD